MSVVQDVVRRFTASVGPNREKVAVEAADGIATYGAFERATARLARRLCRLGVGPDVPVGVSLPRGLGELAALVAVLRAGGAYVPLVPNHPVDRLRLILEDAVPRVLITYEGSPLAREPIASVITLDTAAILADATEPDPDVAIDLDPQPDQLAYVMFTSGSTGRPKGVEVRRSGVANFLASMTHTPGLSAADRVLAIGTSGFDISVLELFGPLVVGATCVLVDSDTARDPRSLKPRVEAARLTVMQATPATWRLLLEAGWTGGSHLKMLCGGEALSTALADRLLATGGELWNMYGPTETTVWSTVERIEAGYDRITIGRAIDATQIYILGDDLLPVAPGVEGELAIGGAGLARGYRNRPELTAARFVRDPPGRPGDRIYRTGDLARMLADGRVEWLGRLDHQVKIRGFRIELGEIESILREVEGVSDALVVAEKRPDDDPRLVAYWIGPARGEALVEAVNRALPPYMRPGAYVSLAAFPLNTNGKVDRAALPAPDSAPSPDDRVGTLPRTDNESRIAAIWRDVLNRAEISIEQDFFSLGGNSALAVAVATRIEAEFGTALPLQAIFAAPTVAGLAERLGESTAVDAPIVVELRRGRSGAPPLFCLFGVVLYQELAHALSGDRTVVGMHVPFRYVPGRDPRPTLPEIGRRYVELIRAHQPHGPYELLGLCFGGIVAYEVARQLEAEGERVRNVAIIDAVLPTAVTVDLARRLRSYGDAARRALREPQRFEQWIRRRGRDLLGRVPLVGRLSTRAFGPHDQPIELPVDGPEVEAELRRFSGAPSHVDAKLVVVRAAREPIPDWMAISSDHGWGTRAARVSVHDIDADHLGVLKAPEVSRLAEVLAGVS